MSDERNWRNLHEVEDLPADIDTCIEETLGWFTERKTVPPEAFIDQLCKTYGGSGEGPDDWDMDAYDSPAAREILRRARKLKREEQA